MKKKLIFLMFMIIVFLNAENKITTFIGGDYKISTKLYCPSIYSSHQILKGQNRYNSVSSFINNPAGLAFIESPIYATKFAPSFSLNPDTFYSIYDSNGINGKVATIVDEVIDNMSDPELVPDYPDMNIDSGQSGGFQQFSAAIPNRYGTIGINFQRDFYLDFAMTGNGSSGILEDIADDEVTKVALDVEMFSDFEIEMNSINLGFGRKISDKIYVGGGSSLISTKFNGRFDTLIDGMIRQYGGNADVSFAFNDPTDANNFRNTLNSSIDINLDAKTLKIFTGINYFYDDYLFSFTFKSPSKSKLNGEVNIVQHVLGAINPEAFSADSDEELVDATLFELSKMTYTNQTQFVSKKMNLYLPGEVEFSAIKDFGKFDFTLSYAKLLGDLAIYYKCDVFENGREKVDGIFQEYDRESVKEYTVGIKPQHLMKLSTRFIGFKKIAFEFDSGILFAKQILDNVMDEDDKQIAENSFILPLFSTNCNIELYKSINLNFEFLTFPNPVIQMMLSYTF